MSMHRNDGSADADAEKAPVDAKRVTREQRRARMPTVAALVDEFGAEFGAVTLDYAEEGGLVWGAKPPEAYAVNVGDMECYAVHGREQAARGGASMESRESRARARGQASPQAASRGARGVSRVADGGQA